MRNNKKRFCFDLDGIICTTKKNYYKKSKPKKNVIEMINNLYKKNYIKELEGFLKTTSSSKTNKVLRKQKVPRATINDGPQKNIYKRYALGKYQAGSNHEDDYNNKVDSAKQNCSLQAFEALMRISKDYEEIFGLWF